MIVAKTFFRHEVVDEVWMIGIDPRIEHRDDHTLARQTRGMDTVDADERVPFGKAGSQLVVEVDRNDLGVSAKPFDRRSGYSTREPTQRVEAMSQIQGSPCQRTQNPVLACMNCGAT